MVIEMLFRPGAPCAQHKGLIFFGEFKNVGEVRTVWKELGFGWAGSSMRAGCKPSGAASSSSQCWRPPGRTMRGIGGGTSRAFVLPEPL